MRAWRAHAYGPYREVLSFDECDAPTPPDDGALVRNSAASLNFPDLLAYVLLSALHRQAHRRYAW